MRLDIAYKCLKTSFIRENPGACPTDSTDLVPVTASVFWVCESEAEREKHYLEPGACGDGSRRGKAFEVRPHGDHNPRHGGPAVFMSEDLYHHVEATLVAPTGTQPAIFRVYLYDEYTRPLHVSGVSAQLVATDRNGKPTGTPVPLVLSRIRDGNAMEVRLPNAAVERERVRLLRAACKAQAVREGLADGPHVHVVLERTCFKGASPCPVCRHDGERGSNTTRESSADSAGSARSVGPAAETKQDLLAELQKNIWSPKSGGTAISEPSGIQRSASRMLR